MKTTAKISVRLLAVMFIMLLAISCSSNKNDEDTSLQAGTSSLEAAVMPSNNYEQYAGSLCSGTETFWNFTKTEFTNALPSSGSDNITKSYTINGLTIVYGNAAMSYTSNSKSIDGYNFNYRFQLAGTGSTANRALKFNVAGACNIIVYGMSGNSANTRSLALSNGTSELQAIDFPGDAISKGVYSYTGGAATLYLYSKNSGINIYGVKVIDCAAQTPSSSSMADSPVPAFADVTVHDPSIFRVNDNSATDKYRIVGSFLGSAKTGDFIKWTLEQSGGTSTSLKYYPKDNPNASIQKVADQRAYVINRMKTTSVPNPGFEFFASDIHKMPSGKFFHYYSMTSEWMGSIGVAIADAADGNYITQGLFVHHNHGASYSWGIPPNCIDPQAFFDKTGANFYMVYGSYSGGIFIYEIDAATGLPKANSAMNAENNGYGRKILHSVHWPIEAPYIIYSPDSDYYYLFVSYGGLAANDGYNIRIFRSRTPYGPYEDTQRSALNLTSSNYGTSGVKIMGGYQFAQVTGENALANKIGRNGFLSPGHNSAYYDPAAKKYFLIHHTRFVGEGEGHAVRAREMFVNEDGWLLAAPFRYDAGTIRAFNAKQLTGAWKILSHGQDINKTARVSQLHTFNENGSITGAATGTWVLGADGKTARITLGGKLYKGVFLRSYDEYHSVWVYAFTAMSSDGLALWGATTGIATNINVK